MEPDGVAPPLMCERDRTPTRLTCATCGTPICPRCFVRTEVGLRCPRCGTGTPLRRRPTGRAVAIVVPLVAALAAATVVIFSRAPRPSPPATERGADADEGPLYRVVERRDLGFAVELPPNWSESPDEPGSVAVFYARSQSAQSWVRVFRRDTPQSVPELVAQLTDGLRKQGASNISLQPTLVNTLPAARLDLQLTTPFGPVGVMSSQTYLLVQRDSTVYTLALGTIDPTTQGPVLARMGSTFRLL